MLAVEIQERIENGYLRICLGFPHSFTLIELYNKTIQHQLPLSSVTEEFKSAKSQSRGCREPEYDWSFHNAIHVYHGKRDQ